MVFVDVAEVSPLLPACFFPFYFLRMYESVHGIWLGDRRDVWLVTYQRDLGVWRFPGVRRIRFLLAIALKLNAVFLCFFLFFVVSFFFLNHMHLFKIQRQHPLAPLHTRRLKSQHHEIISTFLRSTPRHELGLGGGVIPPLLSPTLRFIPLGFLLSGLMDFIFFLWCFLSLPCFCSTSLRASARSATLSSMPMLQTAGNTVCRKRKQFNRARLISLLSLLFVRRPCET